jgi:hypothetical protein
MRNCYWAYISYGFSKEFKYYDNDVYKKAKTPEEWRQKNLTTFLDKLKPNEYFLFCVTDAQLPEFEDSFLNEERIKPLLVYRSKKFCNRTHLRPKDDITLFIFKNHG